ncbi:ROK family protein [Kamptonema cortianum]|nr:ROK family protein [Kamptonema cortianum]
MDNFYYSKGHNLYHPMRCVIGVDLGGTNVRAQAVYEDGSPAGGRVENPSHAQSGTEEILDALSLTIQQAIDSAENEVAGVGLAIPGHIDDAAGLVKWSPNFGKTENGVFSYWKDVEIRRPLRERLGVDVKMANDANCAALGEYLFGSGKGTAHCLVLFTIGTGVGGGVVFGEQSLFGNVSGPAMLLGGNLGGGELGHNIVQRNGLDCNAGSYGALEAYCQRDAIITRAITNFEEPALYHSGSSERRSWQTVAGDFRRSSRDGRCVGTGNLGGSRWLFRHCCRIHDQYLRAGRACDWGSNK